MSDTERTSTLERMMNELKFRPHHITCFEDYENNHDYEMSPEEFTNLFREKYGNIHGDEFVLLWRDFLKGLHDIPNFEFKFVEGFDSVCAECDEIENCKDKSNRIHQYANRLDAEAIERFPELEFGKTYDKSYLKQLFVDKL